MNCPVCKRDLAPTLSICLTCGAMMNDTVREELSSKIGRVSGPLNAAVSIEKPGVKAGAAPIAANKKTESPASVPIPSSPRPMTLELPSKRTSPTLVEFQHRNTTLPEWRLHLQNVVRQRAGGGQAAAAVSTPVLETSNQSIAVARPEPSAPALEIQPAGNERVANALRRIEASRNAFLPESSPKSQIIPVNARQEPPNRNFPFNIVSRTHAADASPVVPRAEIAPPPKPKLISSFRIEKKGFDTNKLPPLPSPTKISSSFISGPLFSEELEEPIIKDSDFESDISDINDAGQVEFEEIDDLAPFSMRFGAGLFDQIIAGFASLIILSPLMVTGGSWLTLSGILAFTATLAIILFLYMTAAIGFWGQTFGMRIFSLELIDADENAYPSMHQAAVNSAVYLLSMAFAGAGFITIPFSEERRAVHDIVSGTILVRDI